jgi:hypothetical protein
LVYGGSILHWIFYRAIFKEMKIISPGIQDDFLEVARKFLNKNVYFKGYGEVGEMHMGIIKNIEGNTITFDNHTKGKESVYFIAEIIIAIPQI